MSDENSHGGTIAETTAATIRALGYDLNDPHLKDTPKRVAAFLTEWHTQLRDPPAITLFPNDIGTQPITVESIVFHSLCAHHGVPFFGTVAIRYWPDESLIGLSKLTRVVDYFAHRFQIQERLGKQIAEHLWALSNAHAVEVTIRAEHLCVSMRGVARAGQQTVTVYTAGAEVRAAEAARQGDLFGGNRQ